MLEFFIKHSPTIGLLIFFSVFCYVTWIVVKPGSKKKFDKFSEIPFKDENSKNEIKKNKKK